MVFVHLQEVNVLLLLRPWLGAKVSLEGVSVADQVLGVKRLLALERGLERLQVLVLLLDQVFRHLQLALELPYNRFKLLGLLESEHELALLRGLELFNHLLQIAHFKLLLLKLLAQRLPFLHQLGLVVKLR